MRYLWTNYDEKNFYITDETPPLPFEEIAGEIIEKRGENFVETTKINALLRFEKIFLPLINFFNDDKISVRREIENIFYHFLAHIDFLCGKNKFTFTDEMIYDELEKNFYGNRAGEIFRQLNPREQNKIVNILRKHEEYEGRELFFFAAVKKFFPAAKIYFYEEEKKIFIFLPQKENDRDKIISELLQILFYDIFSPPPEFFWQHHFGIICEELTMRIDELSLY